jgi:hypothetical protein
MSERETAARTAKFEPPIHDDDALDGNTDSRHSHVHERAHFNAAGELVAPEHSLVHVLGVVGNGRGDLRGTCPFCHRRGAAVLISSTRWRCTFCGERDKTELVADVAQRDFDEWQAP